jgi:hypothetical protein
MNGKEEVWESFMMSSPSNSTRNSRTGAPTRAFGRPSVTALHPDSALTPRSSKFGSTARASGLPCSRHYQGQIARKLRVQCPGTVYHMMNRGDRWEDIVEIDNDRQLFLETLRQGCSRTD